MEFGNGGFVTLDSYSAIQRYIFGELKRAIKAGLFLRKPNRRIGSCDGDDSDAMKR